ncbi:Meiotically up-regulated protein 72 protein [Elsinoe australis]|uniref:2-dehydropantoate 2-reductase n=1 Tax=Elsinoe australis TaxID=40998 RepID=A0A2P7ZMK2_9PEZI|nr:Meiotically up-regulated protein 72 protein [Elsinoe australis]
MSRPKVLLFGSGAIGTIYVYILQQAGCDVSAVSNGFTINSAIYGQNIHIQPPVYRTIEDACPPSTTYDYIIITTKSFPSPVPLLAPSPSAAAIGPAITPSHTTIVLIQNGLLIEEEYKAAYPSNPLLSCVVYLPTTQISPAVIEMGELELLEIGTYPSASPPQNSRAFASTTSTSGVEQDAAAANAFKDLIRKGNGTAHVYLDIQAQRWKKLLLNCGWNPVCALSWSRDVGVLGACDEAEGYVKAVMVEVAGVARAVGYAGVDENMVDGVMERAKARMGTKGIEPSMLADVRGGRRMEVEAILGGVMRLGKEMGLGVSRLEGLYVLSRALDQRIGEGLV